MMENRNGLIVDAMVTQADRRTTRHNGYQISQKERLLIEKANERSWSDPG